MALMVNIERILINNKAELVVTRPANGVCLMVALPGEAHFGVDE